MSIFRSIYVDKTSDTLVFESRVIVIFVAVLLNMFQAIFVSTLQIVTSNTRRVISRLSSLRRQIEFTLIFLLTI